VQLKKALSVAHLPALPQSAIRLLELSKNPTTGPAEFAIPIEFDPGLAGQVLRFVNSSYFGFAREISSVKMAIALVGMRTIKNFALWNAVFSLMPNPKCGPFDLKALWQDSLRRALFARAFGKMLHLDEDDDPFAAALLQDMAVPLLAKEAPEVYRQLLLDRGFQNARLSTLEEQKFGWSHAAAGGIIARQWNLPEQFAVLIENHVAVDVWIEQRQREPAKLAVALSALLPSTSDSFWIERGEFETCYGRAAPPASPSVPAMLAQIDSEFEKFAPVLKVSTPAKSLLDWYQEASVGVA
jgi:HD-like signal output (HDOD) protein